MSGDARRLIEALGLEPHPEGGHYRETFRDDPGDGGRGAVTSIFYLLQAGERSHWHRVDAVEIWCFHAGAPLELSLSSDGVSEHSFILGPDTDKDQRPQAVVPKDAWQSARSLGDWTLVGCIVAPAFDFAGFELAPDGWTPG